MLDVRVDFRIFARYSFLLEDFPELVRLLMTSRSNLLRTADTARKRDSKNLVAGALPSDCLGIELVGFVCVISRFCQTLI